MLLREGDKGGSGIVSAAVLRISELNTWQPTKHRYERSSIPDSCPKRHAFLKNKLNCRVAPRLVRSFAGDGKVLGLQQQDLLIECLLITVQCGFNRNCCCLLNVFTKANSLGAVHMIIWDRNSACVVEKHGFVGTCR